MAGARNRDRVRGGDVVVVCVQVSKARTSCFSRCRMRRLLPRSLWLLAWSCWAWLGFGLWREVPRDMGPVVCKLPLANQDAALGFVDRSGLAVSMFPGPGIYSTGYRVYDVGTGSRVREVTPERRTPFMWQSS